MVGGKTGDGVYSSWELIVACSKQRNIAQGKLAFHGSTVHEASWLFSNSRVRGSQLLQILFVIKTTQETLVHLPKRLNFKFQISKLVYKT